MNELIFSKIVGLLPITSLKKTPSQVFFKEFDHRLQSTYFTECFSVAAPKIHKFLTSFMKLVLEITIRAIVMVGKLLLDFTVLKSYVEISYKPAKNMFKVNNKDTRTTSIDLAPVSLF